MNRKNSSESGQIVVILAVAFMALLGFAALSIDVGMTYADRRSAQNVADSAVLAAAQKMADQVKSDPTFNCAAVSKTAATTAAAARTLSNGFAITLNAAENGISFICPANNTYIDMKVTISSVSKTFFIQLFYGGQVKNTVTAVSRVAPRQPTMAGFLVYVLDQDCNNHNIEGIDWRGTSDAYLFGGGAFTRSCLRGNGNTEFKVMGNGETTNKCKNSVGTAGSAINCDGSNPDYTPSWCNDSHFSPAPAPVPDPMSGFSLPDITTCSATVITSAPSGGNFTPGTYQIDSKAWDGAVLQPGLYCIKGDISLQGNGATITSVAPGVTVYMIDGGISCKGNCGINLKSVAQNATPLGGAIPGLVLMSKHGNTSTITLGGNSGSDFAGTAYVPDGVIDLGGTGDVPTSSQFIAQSMKSHGTPQLCVQYDSNQFVTSPAKFQIQR